jgi:hypothetical protein
VIGSVLRVKRPLHYLFIPDLFNDTLTAQEGNEGRIERNLLERSDLDVAKLRLGLCVNELMITMKNLRVDDLLS